MRDFDAGFGGAGKHNGWINCICSVKLQIVKYFGSHIFTQLPFYLLPSFFILNYFFGFQSKNYVVGQSQSDAESKQLVRADLHKGGNLPRYNL